METKKGRTSAGEYYEKMQDLLQEVKKELEEKVKEVENTSYLLCPDCGKDGNKVKMHWKNADQLSFGDYVDLRAELKCPDCHSFWQFKLPQMQRSQPQNKLTNTVTEW
mgnify:FL=1